MNQFYPNGILKQNQHLPTCVEIASEIKLTSSIISIIKLQSFSFLAVSLALCSVKPIVKNLFKILLSRSIFAIASGKLPRLLNLQNKYENMWLLRKACCACVEQNGWPDFFSYLLYCWCQILRTGWLVNRRTRAE